jgi:hypothetical protein
MAHIELIYSWLIAQNTDSDDDNNVFRETKGKNGF